jgi:hypothetical protein
MAGSFGFQRDKFDVSQAVAERVLRPAVRNARRFQEGAESGSIVFGLE